MKRLIIGSRNWCLISSNSRLMSQNIWPRSSIEFQSAISRNYAVVLGPGLHPITHIHCLLPESVISSYQAKSAFGLSNHIVSVNRSTKSSSVVKISHNRHIGIHSCLVKGRAIPTRPIQTAFASSKHIVCLVKRAEVILTGRS